jgi:hypothetical protein
VEEEPMKSTPLVIGPTEKQVLSDLRALAVRHPVDMKDLLPKLETPDGKATHMAQMTRQSVEIPFGYIVTFSIELGHPCGTARHLSMSSPRRGRLPTPEAVQMVMDELGFAGPLKQCAVWLEDLSGREKAVNVVEPVAISEASGTA